MFRQLRKNKKSSKEEKIDIDVTKIKFEPSRWDAEEKILEQKSDAEEINLENKSHALKTTLKSKSPAIKINLKNKSDIKKLINILTYNIDETVIVPNICYNENIITYPILEQIGHDKNDIDFLEQLASSEINVLKKLTHERVLVCPEHPQYFTLSPRQCCISCESANISKLHLFEHTACGYLAESTEFKEELTDGISTCPSCKSKINNLKTDIRVAGNWYKCNDCKTKFDDAKFKFYCRQFDHDFDIGNAEMIPIPSYEILNKADQVSGEKFVTISEIKGLLETKKFFTEEHAKVKGKSGIEHAVNLYGSNSEGMSIVVFIENEENEINVKVNDVLMKVNDISPTFTVLVGFPSISDDAKALIKANNILLVTSTESEEILSKVKEYVSNFSHIPSKSEEI